MKMPVGGGGMPLAAVTIRFFDIVVLLVKHIISPKHCDILLRCKGCMVDALALAADEGRGKLR